MADFTATLSSEQHPHWLSAVELARTCRYDQPHAEQVTRLALRIFDELQPLHGHGSPERFLLQCAGILHDVGWIEGWQAHHKKSLAIILGASQLTFDSTSRYIIASIARYHRKALPDMKHDHYASLTEEDRQMVSRLAALLRIADGLDVSHASHVLDVQCDIKAKQVILTAIARSTQLPEEQAALKKSDLFEREYSRKITICWRKPSK